MLVRSYLDAIVGERVGPLLAYSAMAITNFYMLIVNIVACVFNSVVGVAESVAQCAEWKFGLT